MAADTSHTTTRTDDEAIFRIETAYAAFRDVLDTGLQPSLTATIGGGADWRAGEYDVVIEPNSMTGTMHEQIVQLVAIAEKHGGRVWHDRRDGKLAILFPYDKPFGPGDPSPVEVEQRRARKAARS